MVSRAIDSHQDGPHPRLEETVRRHLKTPFRKPIAAHSYVSFAEAQEAISIHGGPVILDAGCGTGESTCYLAESFPDHFILGVDKSAHRLGKAVQRNLPPNACLIRSDLADFYRLARKEGWHSARHYILYPNPWPKAEHLRRRWQGSPVFPDILALGGRLELRSNWQIYVEEFALALEIAGHSTTRFTVDASTPMTAFERKYAASEQTLYGLVCELSGSGTNPSLAR